MVVYFQWSVFGEEWLPLGYASTYFFLIFLLQSGKAYGILRIRFGCSSSVFVMVSCLLGLLSTDTMLSKSLPTRCAIQ